MNNETRDRLAKEYLGDSAVGSVKSLWDRAWGAALASLPQAEEPFPEAEFLNWYSRLHEVDKSPAEKEIALWVWARAKGRTK